MPSQEKKEKVKQIKKWFDKTDSLLVMNYKGLSVSEANELRVKLKDMDSELRVLKNTLTRIAVADSPKEGITPLLDGPIAVVFVHEDAAATAKALRDYSRGRKDFYLRGGLLDGRVLDGRQVEAFATLPPREVLLAQMVGVVQAPLSRVLGAVAAPARKMLGLFQALADLRASEAPPPPPAPVAEPEAEEPTAAEAPAEETGAPQEAEEPAAEAKEPEPKGEPAPAVEEPPAEETASGDDPAEA
jgi:large subunit ribosomal protein L10